MSNLRRLTSPEFLGAVGTADWRGHELWEYGKQRLPGKPGDPEFARRYHELSATKEEAPASEAGARLPALRPTPERDVVVGVAPEPPKRDVVAIHAWQLPKSLLKLRYPDLVRMGIVTGRSHMEAMIKDGRLRPPHKTGKTPQSKSFWYADEIEEDLIRERIRLTGTSGPAGWVEAVLIPKP